MTQRREKHLRGRIDLLDADPDQRDRRVELYFFDRKLVLRIRLFDHLSRPMPGARYQLVFAKKVLLGCADGSGCAVVEGRPPQDVACLVRWGQLPQRDDPEDPLAYAYERTIRLDAGLDTSSDSLRTKLANLGYDSHADDTHAVRHFQHHQGLSASGDIHDPETTAAICYVHDTMSPKAREAEVIRQPHADGE